MAKRSVLAALLGAPLAAASSCESVSYAAEASPFGWPVTPVFSHDEECWAAQHPFCGGANQSPMDLALTSCAPEESGGAPLKDAAAYASSADLKTASAQAVQVSKYLGSVMAQGAFGELKLQDMTGHDVVYEASQVHITAGSFHSMNGTGYDAELLVVHSEKGAKDPLAGRVVLSALFKKSESESSPIFEQLLGAGAEKAEWSVPAFGLADSLKTALNGPFYQYNGSIPVPPCAETATWLVLGAVQGVSAARLEKLTQVLAREAGGHAKRQRLPQKSASGRCRRVVKNGHQVAPLHEEATCAALGEKGPARCHAAARCAASPIIEAAAAQTAAKAGNASGLFHYVPRSSWKLVPGADSTLLVPAAGDLGYLMLNGRQYLAKDAAIRPASSQVLGGKRYAAELTIRHVPYHAAVASAPAEEKVEHGSHRRLSGDSQEVLVSVPIAIGQESPFLRAVGWGKPALKRAMAAGNDYDLEQELSLAAALAAPMAGSWYWYQSGEGSGCEGHAKRARHLAFSTPLEMSVAQLNDVVPKVSGMDAAVFPAAAPAQLWKNALPPHAVSAGGVCSGPWSHQNAHCWKGNWSTCGGAKQSPINVETAAVKSVGGDSFLAKCSWKPISGLDVENSGKMLQVVNNQLGYFAFVAGDGTQAYYQVTGLKLHMPSEHMVDGKHFDAELQVVHQKQRAVNDLMEDDMATASFFFRVDGQESGLLKQFHLPGHPVKEGAPSEMAQPLDLMRALGPAMEAGFYRYDGSLTVPDCSEHTKWFLFDTPMSMSQEQLDAFKALFPNGNSRPVQALNGRAVHRNSFQEGVLTIHEFYLNRNKGRSRSDWNRSETLILIPIIFIVFFSIFIMAALFQREDKVAVQESAGGLSDLADPIGKKQQKYSRF